MGHMGKARFEVLKSETNRHISRLIWCPFEHGKCCESLSSLLSNFKCIILQALSFLNFPLVELSLCLYKGHSSLAASTSKRSIWLLCLCCFAFWAFSLSAVLMFLPPLPYILMVIKHCLL